MFDLLDTKTSLLIYKIITLTVRFIISIVIYIIKRIFNDVMLSNWY